MLGQTLLEDGARELVPRCFSKQDIFHEVGTLNCSLELESDRMGNPRVTVYDRTGMKMLRIGPSKGALLGRVPLGHHCASGNVLDLELR